MQNNTTLLYENQSISKSNGKSKTTRYSGVELLRILAMFLICIYHATLTSKSYLDFSSHSFGIIVLNIFYSFGQIGNILFVICSSYFLLDSRHTKKEKAIKLLLDSMIISILIFVTFVICGYKVSGAGECIKNIFPDLYDNVWFVTTYFLFYLIHPILNLAIERLGKKSHFTLLLFVFLLYGVYGTFTYFSVGVNDLIKFVLVYFVVAYMKKYYQDFCKNRRKNTILFLIFAGIYILLLVLKNFLISITIALDIWFSPFLLPMLLFLFNIFNSFKFTNKTINYIASCSLFVYCIHDNLLLRSVTRPKYFEYVLSKSPNMYFGWVILCGIVMFFGAYILSLLYRVTLSKLTDFLSKKLAIVTDKIIDFIYNLFTKSKTETNETLQIEFSENRQTNENDNTDNKLLNKIENAEQTSEENSNKIYSINNDNKNKEEK